MSATISGALIAQPTTQNLIPKEGPKSIPISFPFTGSALSFTVDFSQVIQQGRIACINGLFIDNSANPDSLSVTVQQTGQVIVCPPEAQGIFPIIGPEFTRVTVASLGAVTVLIQFLNTTPTLSVWSVNAGGGGGMGVTSITAGAGLIGGTITSSGTISADLQSVGNGLSLNSGVVSDTGAITLSGTAAGTLAIAPASGISDVIANMPAGGGTVTLSASPAFADQRALLTIKQGATAATVNLASTFKFATSGGPTSYTATATPGAIDRLALYSPDGTNWVVMAAGNGYPV